MPAQESFGTYQVLRPRRGRQALDIPLGCVAFRLSKQRRRQNCRFIAVEMAIADHPPHRSERALLTHSAPTSSI